MDQSIVQKQLQNFLFLEDARHEFPLPSLPADRLFHSAWTNSLLLAEGARATVVTAKDVLKLDFKAKQVLGLAFCYELTLLAIQDSPTSICVLFGRQKRQVRLPLRQQKILAFQFLRLASTELVVVTKRAILVFEVGADKITQTNCLQLRLQNAWWQPLGQVLLVSEEKEPGVVSLFKFEKQHRQLKESQGLKVALQVNRYSCQSSEGLFSYFSRYSKAEKGTATGRLLPGNYNSPLSEKSGLGDQIVPLHLYGKSCFAKIDQEDGKVTVYQVNAQRYICRLYSLTVPAQSRVELSVADNLLLVHLCDERLSMAYDVQSKVVQPLLTPVALRLWEVDVYKGWFLGNGYAIVTSGIFKFGLNYNFLLHYPQIQIDLFKSMLRRSNTKLILLNWLRSAKRASDSRYWEAVVERLASKVLDGNSIQQEEVCEIVLCPLLLQGLPTTTAKRILLTIVELLLATGVAVSARLSQVVVQLLLDKKDYPEIYFLHQNKILRPCAEVAALLLAHPAGPESQRLKQVAYDVLVQGRQVEQLALLLLSEGMGEAGVELLQRRTVRVSSEMLRAASRAGPPWSRVVQQLHESRRHQNAW